MKEGDEMVEIIMVIGGINFILGFLFEKAARTAVYEWRAARKELMDDRN